MEVKYLLCNPTGNITALVESDVTVEKQPTVADMIMKKEPSCEQVGFIMDTKEGSDITMRMAGGEFCGNATLSTAAYYCKKLGLGDGEKKTVYVKVIGVKEIIDVEIEKQGEIFTGLIKMPKPLSIKEEKFVFEGHNYWYPVVSFNGLSHVIIEDNVPVYMPEGCIKMWCDSLHSDGLGLMLLNDKKTALRPLVYVKNPESLVWESSCASGTSAVGAYFAKKENKTVSLSLKEPGGILSVTASPEGEIYLKGSIEF